MVSKYTRSKSTWHTKTALCCVVLCLQRLPASVSQSHPPHPPSFVALDCPCCVLSYSHTLTLKPHDQRATVLPLPQPSTALSCPVLSWPCPMLFCRQRLRASHLILTPTRSCFISTSCLVPTSGIRRQVRAMSVKPSLHFAEDFLSFVNASPTRMFIDTLSYIR